MKHLLPAVQRTALRIPWAAVGGCAAALLLLSKRVFSSSSLVLSRTKPLSSSICSSV